jgi:hypothetical protein
MKRFVQRLCEWLTVLGFSPLKRRGREVPPMGNPFAIRRQLRRDIRRRLWILKLDTGGDCGRGDRAEAK